LCLAETAIFYLRTYLTTVMTSQLNLPFLITNIIICTKNKQF